MSYSVEPRDQARQSFAESGLTYADLSRADFERLRDALGEAMSASETIRDYGIRKAIKLVRWPSGWAALTCQSYYFDNREAVTFGEEGFIGFAGWADDSNVAPILEGFRNWVAETVALKASRNVQMLESGAA